MRERNTKKFRFSALHLLPIIPQREKIGSYDLEQTHIAAMVIIPQREKIGSYDLSDRQS